MRVLLVHKRSNLEAYTRKWGRQRERHRTAVERVFSAAHAAHERTVDEAVELLIKGGAAVHVRLRDELGRFDERNYDFVLTVGGDGTLLAVAAQLKNTPVLAVNSSPKTSVGFFAAASRKTLPAFLQRIQNGEEKPWLLARMEVRKNGKRVGHPALNDALFAHPSPVMTTRLCMKPPGVKKGEEQKTSGVWVSTPSGSSSAARAAGGVLLPIAARDIQYIVREPYVTVNERYRYTKGVVCAGETLIIESRLPKAVVYVDGTAHAEHAGFGDVLSFAIAPTPLMIFGQSAVMRAIHGE